MKKEEAISYLQQLYPNGGHCWLDEQRIEAISMAIEALKKEPNDVVDKYLYGKEPELVDEDDLPTKKDYRERYKRIAESEAFKKTHEGMSIGEVIPVEGEEPVSEELEKASKEWLAPQLDKSYANYGEAKMMELTHFDGYAMLDAIDFGANWQKTKDESTTEDLEEVSRNYADNEEYGDDVYFAIKAAFKAGAQWQKEKDNEEKVLTYKHGFDDCKGQMMSKAIDATCFGFQGAALFTFRLPADSYLVGSKVKVIVIKED